MADYPISNVARRIVYTGSAGVGPYTFPFEVLVNTDIKVYKNDVLLTLTTNYTVSISPTLGTGSVTLVSAATSSDRITIVGARPVERSTDFTTGGDFFAGTLNTELDSQTILIQQVAETAERGIRAPVTDPTNINMVLPVNTARAGKTLAFDADGNPIAGDTIGNWRGNWASGTSYQNRDLIKDTTNSNVYIALSAHTSSGSLPISTNTDSAKWGLVVDAAAANTSATNAAASASAAATSASNAVSSASSASTSASTATTQASNASTSATNAASSASSASTSASNASTSATNAASSATSASASATAAAASAAAGLYSSVQDKSANYTVVAGDAGDLLRVSTGSGAVTITLPQISTVTDGFKVAIVKWTSDVNAVNIARSGSDTINTATSASITMQYSQIICVADYETNTWFASQSGLGATNKSADRFSGNGSTTAFTLSSDPGSYLNTDVFVGGVHQDHSTYNVSGTTLTFTTAPPSGTNNIEVVYGTPLAVGVPSDATISAAKLTSTAIQDKLGYTPVNSAAANNFTAAQRGAVSALTDGATITPDFALSNNYSVTLGGNRTLANPTNMTAGQSGIIVITQDGTGSRTLAYGSYWKFAAGTAPTLTTTASAVDVLCYYVESSTRITARLIGDVK